MHHLKLIMVFLKLLHSFRMGKCASKQICENTTETLECSNGDSIWIESSFYGRVGRRPFCRTLPERGELGCSAPNTSSVVTGLCHCRASCEVAVSDDEFGGNDPCHGSSEYLQIDYRCVPASECRSVATSSSRATDSTPTSHNSASPTIALSTTSALSGITQTLTSTYGAKATTESQTKVATTMELTSESRASIGPPSPTTLGNGGAYQPHTTYSATDNESTLGNEQMKRFDASIAIAVSLSAAFLLLVGVVVIAVRKKADLKSCLRFKSEESSVHLPPRTDARSASIHHAASAHDFSDRVMVNNIPYHTTKSPVGGELSVRAARRQPPEDHPPPAGGTMGSRPSPHPTAPSNPPRYEVIGPDPTQGVPLPPEPTGEVVLNAIYNVDLACSETKENVLYKSFDETTKACE